MPDKCVDACEFRFFIDKLDSLGLGSNGTFEPDTLAAIKRLVKPGARVLDIGANIGFLTANLSRLVGPEGRVYAIEPQQENLRLLKKNVLINGLENVDVYNVAAGESEGAASLFLSDWNGGMHRLYESVCCTEVTESVTVATVDSIVANDKIDLIKIDIEGYEFFALKGARNCLLRNPDIHIVTEYCPLTSMEAGASPAALLNYLYDMDFKPMSLDGRLVNPAELLEEAIKCEAYGAERFVAKCSGKTNPQILEAAQAIAKQLGCRRPILENLIFSR